jgi:hypothetical protein
MERTSLPRKNRLRRFILGLGLAGSLAGGGLVSVSPLGRQAVCDYWNSWSPAPLAIPPVAHRISEDLVETEAPEFLLRDVDGVAVRSRDYLGRLPIVIEFGSVT